MRSVFFPLFLCLLRAFVHTKSAHVHIQLNSISIFWQWFRLDSVCASYKSRFDNCPQIITTWNAGLLFLYTHMKTKKLNFQYMFAVTKKLLLKSVGSIKVFKVSVISGQQPKPLKTRQTIEIYKIRVTRKRERENSSSDEITIIWSEESAVAGAIVHNNGRIKCTERKIVRVPLALMKRERHTYKHIYVIHIVFAICPNSTFSLHTSCRN